MAGGRGVPSGVLGNRYLNRLRKMQDDYPKAALKQPVSRDAFEYGRHCGVLEGLLLAEQLLSEEIEGEKNDKSG